MQQFDQQMIKKTIDAFERSSSCVTYYKYLPDGWQLSDADSCTGCTYFDIHNAAGYEPDYAAAARAVACIEMRM
jgi:hypothetical protein